ncbi:MAG TPA: bifunctional DNA primase/polymerase [Candidatus Nitrosotalea sp.]|nr:bifunctional DNA primase/polymerase [Candidatus Nitrosotalea sp.]
MADRSNEAKDVLDSALAYARRGWSVVPVWPREKRPLIPWAPYQHHRPDEAEIRQWFRRWPSANVGIVTGAVSSLVVVDVDPLHGGDDSLRALEQAHGPLPDTMTAATGGGGLHVYLAHPGGRVPNEVGLVAGIDLRGDGGFVVAPPSVHPSGRRYAWLGTDLVAAPLPAPMPPWLLHLVRERGYRPGHSLAHWRRLVKEGIQEGERNNSIASLAGHLLWHGIDPEVILDLLLCWNARRCRPPLSDDEVARTVESIARLHES